MRKRIIAIISAVVVAAGLVLTQASSLSALAGESPSEEPIVTVETETPVEVSEAMLLEEPAFLGDSSDGGGTRSAGGQYRIYTYVTGEGTVTATVDGVETTSADPVDDVILTIAPAAGWEFSDLKVTNSDSEEQRIFPQSDGTYLFWMPSSLARVYVTFTQSSTDPETSFFGVLITDADGNGNASGSSYTMDYRGMEGESSRTSASNNFVENGDGVFLYANPADGYKFLGWYQGDPDKADGKLYTGEPLTTSMLYEFTAPIGLERPYVCAVFDVDDSRDYNQYQIWVGNYAGDEVGFTPHGKVAVEYTPSEPNVEGFPSYDGTSFSYSQIFDAYIGDEVTLHAAPDNGYRFVGWYEADGEWPANGPRRYTGEALSTSNSYTFEPSWTNRLICAVFDVDDTPQPDQVQMWVGNIEFTPGGMTAQGGRVAVQYTPSYDVYPNIVAKDGTDFVYGEILPFYKGDECTVYQQPDPGYRFVGWYHANGENIGGLFYEGDPISTEDTFTYKPGKTVVPGDTEPLRYVCAVFEKEEAATVTVTFDAQGGTPEPAAQTITSGGKATCPESPSRAGWSFRGWYTDKVYTNDYFYNFDTPVTEDMTLYAGWYKAQVLFPYDITKEEPGGGTFSLDGAAPKDNVFVAMIFDGETHTLAATPNEGYEFVGWSTSNSEDGVVSTDAEYTYESKDATDCYALFKVKPTTLTLHWSSIDGRDLVEPIVIENIEKGTQVYEALGTIGLNMMSHPFEKEGYIAADYKVNKPITEYADYDAMDADWVDAFAPIESDMDIYCIMLKAIDEAEISFEAPLCGTETNTPSYTISGIDSIFWNWSQQTNKPVFSVPEGKNYHADPSDWASSWYADETGRAPYIGTFTGGEAYYADAWLEADFGYTFASDDPDAVPDAEYSGTATVNGAEFVETHYDWDFLGIEVLITAVHDPAEAVEENRVEPTCVTPGSYDEVVYCKGCGAELYRETKEITTTGHTPGSPVKENEVAPTCTTGGGYDEVVYCEICGEELSRSSLEIPPLGHAWGEWIVDKDATEEEAGLCHRECSRCGEGEEEVIPMIIASYNVVEGDGATWYIGSGDSLSFTFKRSVNDAATFGNFKRIEVDGKEVASADYTAEEGSVIITLKQEFLATLEAGVHKLTAFFENGKSADATFTVKAKDEAPADDQKPDDQKPDAPKTAPKTGDTARVWLYIGIAAAALLCAALTLVIYKRKKTER